CRPDVHHAEVVAAAHCVARVGLPDSAPVLTLHGGTEDTRPAAQASPRQRGRPRARILVDVARIRRNELRLSIIGLPGDLRLHTLEERRLIEDCVVVATPERVARREASIAGFRADSADCAGRIRSATRNKRCTTGRARIVCAIAARVRTGLLATADDRGRGTPAADRAYVPETERLRPRRLPSAEIAVTEVAAQADARVASRRVAVEGAIAARHLHVEFGLEPCGHSTAERLGRAQA